MPLLPRATRSSGSRRPSRRRASGRPPRRPSPSARRPRGDPRRSARAAGAHALARRGAGRTGGYGTNLDYMKDWSTTGATATTGARRRPSSTPSAVHASARRHRHPLHPRAGRRAGPDAAAAVARLAGLDRGVPRAHPAADRSGALRRRSGRRLHRGRALAARLRVLVPARASRASASREIADCFAELMTDVLGYERFAAQGGDWGAFVAARLGARHPERVAGIHLNLLPVRARPADAADADRRGGAQYLDGARALAARGDRLPVRSRARSRRRSPTALTDSPAGLAAWIVEKFRTWSDCGGDVERRFTKDELLTNIMLYWVTGAIGSSFWPYYASLHEAWPLPNARSRCRPPTPPSRARSATRRGAGPSRLQHPALDRDAARRPLRRARGPGAARRRRRAFFRSLRQDG